MHKRELIIIGSAYCSKLREQAGDGTQYMEEFRVLEEEFSCLDSVVMREAVQKKKNNCRNGLRRHIFASC